MSETISKEVLKLDFITDNLKTSSININYPKEDVTSQEVKTVMQTLTTNKVLLSSAGILETPKSATIVKTDKTTIEIE